MKRLLSPFHISLSSVFIILVSHRPLFCFLKILSSFLAQGLCASYCSLCSGCLLLPHPTWLLVFLLYHLSYPGGLSCPLRDGWLISLYESNPSTTTLRHAALNVLFSSEPLPTSVANNLRAVTFSLWLVDPQ